MRAVRFGLIVAVALSFPLGAHAAEPLTAAKQDDTRKLLQVTGALAVGRQMSEAVVDQMTTMLKKARPDLPAHVVDILADEVNRVIAEEMAAEGGLVDLLVGLYHEHFTHQEIRELLAFYETPIGRKAAALAPVLSQEGLRIGQQWGEGLGPKIVERVTRRLQREGIDL